MMDGENHIDKTQDVLQNEPDDERTISDTLNWALGLAGAFGGAVAGYYLFGWILRQGFYAIILPGLFAGLGCGYLLRKQSVWIPILCGIIAFVAGLLSDWNFFPFAKDQSLVFYLSHLHHLQPITMILIALGGFFGYWYGRSSKKH